MTTSRAQKGRLVFTRKLGISQVHLRSWLASEARGGSYREGRTSHTLILVPGIKFSLPWKYVIHRDVKECDRQRPPPSGNLYNLYQCMGPCSKQPLGWPRNGSTELSGSTVWADSNRGLCWQYCFHHSITVMITSTGNVCLHPWMAYDHLLSRSFWSNMKRLHALKKNYYVKVHLKASPADGK